MKKSVYTALAFSAIILSAALPGCKKDENNSPSIVGEWEAREEHFLETNTTTNPPTTIYKQDTTYAAGQGLYINLRSDNRYVSKEYFNAPVSDSGTYSYADNRLITKSMMHTPSTPDTASVILNADDFTISLTEVDGSSKTEISFKFARR